MNGRILCGNTVKQDDSAQRAQRTQRKEYRQLTKDKREKGKDRRQKTEDRNLCSQCYLETLKSIDCKINA